MHYPLFLDLAGARAVVIGGGNVAARKIRSLLKAGALVIVISPAILPAIRRMKRVRCICRAYRKGDLRAARIVVAATNDLAVNRQVCREAKQRRLLVNCAAPPEAGNFLVPSVIRRRGVTIAISTGGVNPSRAKALRQRLEKLLP